MKAARLNDTSRRKDLRFQLIEACSCTRLGAFYAFGEKVNTPITATLTAPENTAAC